MRFAAAFTIEKEHFVNISKHFHKYGDSSDLQKTRQIQTRARCKSINGFSPTFLPCHGKSIKTANCKDMFARKHAVELPRKKNVSVMNFD